MITEDDLRDLVNKVQRMPNRTDLLNHLAEKYDLHTYLEIGVQVPELNFDKIKCPYKIGVDPDPKAGATHCVTSNSYFENLWINVSSRGDYGISDGYQRKVSREMFDLIFIDGLHTAEQVKKDFENALKILSPNGFIVLHDCNPEKEEHTIVPRPTERGHWNGDVYKFACQLATNWLSYKTIDIDNGCGIFTPNTQEYSLGEVPTWEAFDKNRKELLNLITWDEFISLNSHV